jgi:hypothetical protein
MVSFVKEHFELLDRDCKIAFCEFVGDIPSERPILSILFLYIYIYIYFSFKFKRDKENPVALTFFLV